jgi:hypothetical protein
MKLMSTRGNAIRIPATVSGNMVIPDFVRECLAGGFFQIRIKLTGSTQTGVKQIKAEYSGR